MQLLSRRILCITELLLQLFELLSDHPKVITSSSPTATIISIGHHTHISSFAQQITYTSAHSVTNGSQLLQLPAHLIVLTGEFVYLAVALTVPSLQVHHRLLQVLQVRVTRPQFLC